MLVTSPIAPSAVWASEMPSFALRIAAPRPRISAVIRDATARPAASSRAELMRLPEDRRSIARDRFISARREAFCARSAEVLVLITAMTISLFPLLPGYPHPQHAQAYAVYIFTSGPGQRLKTAG